MSTTITTNSINVSTPTASYNLMASRWDLPTSLLGGTAAMRQKGTKYLPQDPEETDAAWTSRRDRSFLLNAYGKTVNTMTGKVFSKEIILKEDVAQPLKDMWEDIDLEGRRGDVLMEDVFRHAMGYGLCHILVDMPPLPEGATLKDEQDNNHRPYWVKVTPQQVIGWKSKKVGSRQQLTSIRIKEDTIEDDGDYGEREVERIREITLTEFILWVRQKNAQTNQMEWIVEQRGPMTLGYIPLLTLYAKREGFMIGYPPLEDLAWMNVAHWQSASDQRHILHVARVPILFGSGLGENADKIIVGPNRLINGPTGSDLKYVEHTGKAIQSGRDDLADIEMSMKLMGLEFLMPMAGGGQTATAKSLDYADINSPLQFLSVAMGDVIEAALQVSADWLKLGKGAGGSVKMNTDFGITLRDAADVQALIQARLAGEISDETFWEELKRRNILSSDFDPTKEKQLIQKEQKEAAAEADRVAKQQMQLKQAAQPPGAAKGGVPAVGSDVTA